MPSNQQPLIIPDKKSESQEVHEILDGIEEKKESTQKEEGRESSETSTPPASPVEWELYDVLNRGLAEYFNLDLVTLPRLQNRLDLILEWAKENAPTPKGTKGDVIRVIKDLEMRLGTPPWGEKRINYVYKWVRLEKDRLEIIKEQKLLEKEEENVNKT